MNASLKETKAATKAASDVIVTLSQAEVISLAQSIGVNYVTSKSASATMADACKKLFEAKVKLGKRAATKGKPACKVTAAFLEGRFPKGLNASGEAVAEKTLANCASYFKRAVETGKAYNENSEAKKAGDNIMIAFKKSATGEDAAAKLMKLANKMKEANSQLAELAACLVDAIEAAGFEPVEVEEDEADEAE